MEGRGLERGRERREIKEFLGVHYKSSNFQSLLGLLDKIKVKYFQKSAKSRLSSRTIQLTLSSKAFLCLMSNYWQHGQASPNDILLLGYFRFINVFLASKGSLIMEFISL